jgi:hypothetical protein
LIGKGKKHEDEFFIYQLLNDKIKINKFKNDKKKKLSQLVLSYETSNFSHESESNPKEVKQKNKNKNIVKTRVKKKSA